jgi:SAM-dependent methyltransferase
MRLPAYRRFAEAYDWEGSLDFSRQAFHRVTAVCCEHGLPPGRHLDLGCGTGTLAILMANAGWEVVGLDSSAAMLAQAKQKILDARCTVELAQQDMRHLKIEGPVNLVTAFYDTLNHLLFTDDLADTFRGVATALRPGGLFVFDVNTEATFRQIWGGVTHFIKAPKASTIYQTSYDPGTRLAKGLVTGFLRRGDLYEKFEEEILERYWPPEGIEGHLLAAGLRPLRREAFNPFPLPDGADLKWLWIVIR